MKTVRRLSCLTLAVLLCVSTFLACDAGMSKAIVNFDMQDGSPVITHSYWIRAGESRIISAPDEPIKTDYVFLGWYKEAACENKWDFDNDKVCAEADVTLYARFETTSNENEAYLAIVENLEQNAKDYLESSTNYEFVGISEFACNYIEPEPDTVTINPDLSAPHYLSYVCIVEEGGKFGSVGFGFNISRYIDNFIDLKKEMNKGAEPKRNHSTEIPKYKEDNEIYYIISPYVPNDIAPHIQNNPELDVFNKNEMPIIIYSYSNEQTMSGNGEASALFVLLYFPDSKMAFRLTGYYVPQGVYYNKSKYLDLFWAQRVSSLTEHHIEFILN